MSDQVDDAKELRGRLDLPPLPTYIRHGLRVLFVGFNPGRRSAELGHYYAYPGNRFWWLLHQSGLTERQIRPEEDAEVLDLGIGLTDIVGRPSKSSSDLATWELQAGREHLLQLLREYRPAVACYNGKGVYGALVGKSTVSYGLQPASVVPGVMDFVAASPSGRSRETIATKLALCRDLRALTLRPKA